jgi:hypothetical protein
MKPPSQEGMMRMWLRLSLIAISVLLASQAVAHAQAVVTSKLEWDQPGASLAEVQTYTYRVYADAAQAGTTLPGVTCAGVAAPYQCSASFPAFTPGAHTLTLTAINAAGESPKSAPLNFTFVVIPQAPTALRIR